MNNVEFSLLLAEQYDIFILLLFLNASITFMVIRKYIHTLYDPLFLIIVFSVFANTVPLFLYHNDVLSYSKLFYFILSESFFWIGFVLMGKHKISLFDSARRSKMGPNDLFKLFKYSLCCIVVLQVVSYMIGGIPILQESRFSSRQIPLVAVMGRIMYFPKIYVWVYSFYLIFRTFKLVKTRLMGMGAIVLLILFSFFGGSKAFIMDAVLAYFIYSYFFLRKKPSISKKMLSIILLSPLLVIFVYYGISNWFGAFSFFMFRFVAAGDGYWQGFAYDVIDSIDNTAHWYERVFSFILGPLHLISQNAKIPIGTLILNQVDPGTIGLLEGPNSRVSIFSYACFGYLGFIFSFIIGVLTSMIAYHKIFSIPRGIVGATLIGMIYTTAITMMTDVVMCLSGIIDICFAVFLINIFSIVFCHKRGLILFYHKKS